MSKALKILSRPKGNAEEYGRWSVNPFVGCSHGCEYCYLKKGPSGAYLGQDKPVLKKGVVSDEHAYHLAMAEIIEHREEIIRDGGLFMTFTSDPMVDVCRDLFFKIAIDSVQYKIPIVILTKATKFWNSDQYYILSAIPSLGFQSKQYVSFGWTLTGHDELEPNAPSNEERLRDMEIMRDDGFKVWASIEPVIDFPSALNMVYQAVNAGCQHFKIGLLTDNTRLVRKDFEFGEHHFNAYKVSDCLHFIEDVMRVTNGKATVYWKQSVRDLLGTDLETKIDEYPHSVGKDWSMFTSDVR